MLSIYKINRNSGFIFTGSGVESLDRDDLTFKSLKFLSLETVYVTKKETASGPAATSHAGDKKQADGDVVSTYGDELIRHEELLKDQLSVLKPMQWLTMAPWLST